RILGVNGERLQERAKGIDPSPVDPDAIYDFKSIGNSETLREDTTDETVIATLLRRLARKVAVRLERKEVVAQTLQIMIRYHDRRTITRSLTHDEYFFIEDQIFAIANELFDVNWNGEPIRLLGITAQNLIEKEQAVEQLNLFTYQDHLEDEALQKVIDQLSEKYGENPFKKIKQPVNNDRPTTSFQKDFLDDYKS
ncbi:MAG: DNA polymerase IV, partial [Amphibacillus sp.]|nr:DNA polymerase IV [Amphibacillus sp.]